MRQPEAPGEQTGTWCGECFSQTVTCWGQTPRGRVGGWGQVPLFFTGIPEIRLSIVHHPKHTANKRSCHTWEWFFSKRNISKYPHGMGHSSFHKRGPSFLLYVTE